MLILHHTCPPFKSDCFGAFGSGDSGVQHRRLRSVQSLRSKTRKLRSNRKLRCFRPETPASVVSLGSLRARGGELFHNFPHTPDPKFSPAAATSSKIASGRSPPPESAVPPAPPLPKHWGSSSPPFGSRHEGLGYHSLSFSRISS